MNIQSWFPTVLLTLALMAAGCGGTSAGAGGASGVPTGAQLTYEEAPLLLDTLNVCNLFTDGSDSGVSAGIQTELGSDNEAMLQLLMDSANGFPGTMVFDEVSAGGNLTDVPMVLLGNFKLVDFPMGMSQLISEDAICLVDFSFVETVELFPGTDGNKYSVSFDCATVPYQWINLMTSVVGSAGTLTDLSGEFECILVSAEA